MLVIRNAYDDRDITLTPRHRATGADGEPVTLAVGDAGQAFEVDGDHELVVSTRALNPGEHPLKLDTMGGKPVEEEVTVELTEEEKAAKAAAEAAANAGKTKGDKQPA